MSLLGFTPQLAGTQQADTLTVDRAVAAARTQSPLLQIAIGRRQLAAGRGRTESAWPNPIAEWRRENYTSPLPPDIFATLQLPLDLTGRRWALRQAGQAASRRGVADSSATITRLELIVIQAFWQATLAEELAAIAVHETDARERTAAFDQQRLREGAVAEVTAMRTRLEADRARIAAASARSHAGRARAELAAALGASAATLGVLAPLRLATLPELGALDTTWVGVRERRPDLASIRYAAEEAERRWHAERRGIIGDINVVGGYKGTAGFATGLFGVLVPLPVFNRNDGPRERSRGEYTIARAELVDAENRARAEVLAATRAWEATRDAGRDGASTLDDRASEVARIAEASYREGAISLVELIETQRARADARTTTARWIADVHLAELELRRATGAPLLRNP